MTGPGSGDAPSGGPGQGVENSVVTPAHEAGPTAEGVRRLVEPFLAQGGPVYVTRCCGFVYAGARAADRCGSCKKPTVCVQVASIEEAMAALGVEHGG